MISLLFTITFIRLSARGRTYLRHGNAENSQYYITNWIAFTLLKGAISVRKSQRTSVAVLVM